MAHYHVIFRACDLVTAVHTRGRPFGLDKATTIKSSFLSLLKALEGHRHVIQVVGDRLSRHTEQFFRRFPVSLLNEELGSNENSLRRCVELVDQVPDDRWVYLCEDDYLHDPRAFLFVDELIENRASYLRHLPTPRWLRLLARDLERRPFFVHLPDYPDRYRPNDRHPSLLFHSRHCHWRQVDATTWSFLAPASEMKRRRRKMLTFARGADDGALSRHTYGTLRLRGDRILCLSPIPGMASHLHEGTMSVLGDWEGICNEFLEKLKGLEGIGPAGSISVSPPHFNF